MAYYRNPGMLAHQFATWAGYPEDLKSQVEAVVIDDGSPEPAIDVQRPEGLPALMVGRLAEVSDPSTPPWRQDAARNRAAFEARGEWLFLTDIDHVLPAESLRTLLSRLEQNKNEAYTFHRLDAPDLTPKLDKDGRLHPHPNTYAISKARYWAVGGYDEDYCGIYGTDGPFRRRLLQHMPVVHLDDVAIVRYPRDVIPDASTRVDRAKVKQQNNPAIVQRMGAKERVSAPPVVLSLPWQAQLRPEAA